MEIVLKIKGKDKTYTAGFISARMVRKTIAVSQEINFDNISPEELDKLMDYIVELFRSQFTRDELYDGLASKDLILSLIHIFRKSRGTRHHFKPAGENLGLCAYY